MSTIEELESRIEQRRRVVRDLEKEILTLEALLREEKRKGVGDGKSDKT
jgi:hypothetical protein